MKPRLSRIVVLGFLAATTACSSAPPEECVRAGARLKELGTSGPHGYENAEIPGLINLAREHRSDSSEACRTANWWADDAEKSRPKAVAAKAPGGGNVAAPRGTFSANAVHACNRGCETSLDQCAARAGCRLDTYKRAGADGQFGFGEKNTVGYSCSSDPVTGPAAERAMQSCFDQINTCYQVCVR